MRTSAIYTCAALLAGVAAADDFYNAYGIKMTQVFATPTAEAGLERREDARECAASLAAAISPTFTPPPQLSSWVLDNATPTQPCAITVPASLSSDYLSYRSQASDYLEALPDKAKTLGNCGASDLAISFSQCSTSQTVYFTNAQNQTSSTAFPTLDVPSTIRFEGAANKPSFVLGSALTVAAVLGFALAL